MNTKACIISSSSQMPEVTDEGPGSLVPHLNTDFKQGVNFNHLVGLPSAKYNFRKQQDSFNV